MFDKIPISAIELHEGPLQIIPTYLCPIGLHESRTALRIKDS